MTQAKMAELININLRFYQDLESDEKSASFETIKKLIKGLNIDPAELFGMPSRISMPKSNEHLIEALTELQKENKLLKGKEEYKFSTAEYIMAWGDADPVARQTALKVLRAASDSQVKAKSKA